MSFLESPIAQIKELPKAHKALPQRIALCRQALKQVDRALQPILWAQLHVELGLCLHQMSDADRPRHLEEAIAHFEAALVVYTRRDHAEVWAATMHNLAAVYSERIRGDRAENLEKAICSYNQALEVRTQDASPEDWASTQHNLANVYAQRIKGDRAENLERAIHLYQDALSVWTWERYPLEWARSQNGLGTAYYLRVRGKRSGNLQTAIACFKKTLIVWTRQAHPLAWAEAQDGLGLAWRHYAGDDPAANVEQAITCHRAALEVWCREDHPWKWGRAQHNLGTAWHSRFQGNHADNLEKAVRCYRRALEVRTRDVHPRAWAETTHNLAAAYSERFTAESLEEAIRLYERALEVRTRQDLPLAWAKTQSELGIAYARRIHGERATNLERAVEYYLRTLEVQSPEICPHDWATTQQNLAIFHSERLIGDRAENLRKAISCYKQALKIFDKQSSPMQWATVQTDLADTYWKLGNLKRATHYLDQAVTLCLEVVEALDPPPPSPMWALAHYNLGNAYGDRSRIRGDHGEDQERAIEHYAQALTFYTSQTFPERRANTHNNLAVTYLERRQGDQAKNLLQATHHFDRALEFFTPETFPVDARRAARNLGNLFFGEGRWTEARAAYTAALEAARALYTAAFTEAGREVEIGENAALYAHEAFCLAHLGQLKETLVKLEEGKTRTLAERLGRDAAQLEKAKPEDQKAYREQLNRLKALETEQRAGGRGQMLAGTGRSYTKIARDVKLAREELDTLTQRIHEYLPGFLPAPLDFAAIQALVPDERTALVGFCITEKGSVILVVRPEGEPEAVWIEGFTQTNLSRTIHDWVAAYHSGDRILWKATIERVLNEVGLRLIVPLHTVLQKYGITQLISIPQGNLFLLPLHAVPIGQDGACLLDRYEVSYAPSATVLQRCRERAVQARGQGLLAVMNPQKDPKLVLTLVEGENIAGLFSRDQFVLLKEHKGTKRAVLRNLQGCRYLHFSCHGSYDWNKPLQSGLLLTDPDRLTLEDLQRPYLEFEEAGKKEQLEVNMTAARLVTLSACETGITEATTLRADEYVGLPAGFMLAGAPCVVSSLWSVPDLSTALLMERFYRNHLSGRMDFAAALHEAQLWVRDASFKEVAEYAEKCYCQSKGANKVELLKYMKHYQHLAEKDPIGRPFVHPYYWAAFTMNGA